MDLKLASIIREMVLKHFPDFDKADVEGKFNYCWDTMRKHFSEKYGISIGTYIRRVKLIHAYNLWLQNGAPPIPKRSNYLGIKEFVLKFENEFSFNIETARIKGEDMEKYLFDNEKKLIKRELNSFLSNSIIESFSFDGKNISIKVLPEKLLAYCLGLPTIIVPNEIKTRINLDSLDENALKLLLLFVYKNDNILNGYSNTEISICEPAEYIEAFFETLDNYTLSNPDQFENCSLYHVILPNNSRNTFFSIIDEIIDQTRFCVQLMMLKNAELHSLYTSFITTPIGTSIVDRATKYGCSVEEYKELLWKYTDIGILRYEDALGIITNNHPNQANMNLQNHKHPMD